jgi:hypothetical protein
MTKMTKAANEDLLFVKKSVAIKTRNKGKDKSFLCFWNRIKRIAPITAKGPKALG